MSDSFEWGRIALAMGLMLFGFILLPAFFLVRDQRQVEREAAAALAAQSSDDPSSTHTETGVSR